MRVGFIRFAALALVSAVAACGDRGNDLSVVERLSANSTSRPDEFKVLPQKPLELPEDLTALPVPDPGAGNRTDLTPNLDAEVALTGRGGRAAPVSSDSAILAATGAAGRDPNIRATLRAEDRVWRQENRGRLLERLFSSTTENVVYRDMALDPNPELARLRAAGVWVPSAPAE